MGYFAWTLVVAVGLAAVELTSEISYEYYAQFVVDDSAEALGVYVPPAGEAGGAATAATAATAPDVAENVAHASATGTLSPILLGALHADRGETAMSRTPVSARPAAWSDATAAGAADASVQPNASLASGEDGPSWLRRAAPPAPVEDVELDAAARQTIAALAEDTLEVREDGSVFLPIATQRLFSMRWTVVRMAEVPLTYEIPGHVIRNPVRATTVQATRPGVIESTRETFPSLGMRVRKGDALAYLRPTLSVAEQVDLEAREQRLVNQIQMNHSRIEQLKRVYFVRYRENKIDALRVEIDGLRRELASVQRALSERELLRAPGDGVISHVDVVPGTAVERGRMLFEIVDPDELWVEAADYNPSRSREIRGAVAVSGDDALDLRFVGGGLALNNQAVPLHFQVAGTAGDVSVGDPVTVIVHSGESVEGITLPKDAVLREHDGGWRVWERVSAEEFRPHEVEATRVAGDAMVVHSGLASGMRIVTRAASTLEQTR